MNASDDGSMLEIRARLEVLLRDCSFSTYHHFAPLSNELLTLDKVSAAAAAAAAAATTAAFAPASPACCTMHIFLTGTLTRISSHALRPGQDYSQAADGHQHQGLPCRAPISS
jgi:hypothetical protein